MNIAVYAIAKNEAHHVGRFLSSIIDRADSITVLDTGSDDGTYASLQARQDQGVRVHRATVSPWRFDDARNVALSLVPNDADVCIALDLDEVLLAGWREALEDAWQPNTTRLRYPYVWNWQQDGSPGITYYADKIHRRHGYRWRNPCHEVLAYQGEEVHTFTDALTVHHYADSDKPRSSSYLELMRLALEEDPTDDRMQHYYARELYFQGDHKAAAKWFNLHLDNPRSQWRHERSQSMMYLAHCEPANAASWLYRAVAECPERKETWYELARWELYRGDPGLAAGFAIRAIQTPPDRFYLSDPAAQGDGPHHILAEVKALRQKAMEEQHGRRQADPNRVPDQPGAGHGADAESSKGYAGAVPRDAGTGPE